MDYTPAESKRQKYQSPGTVRRKRAKAMAWEYFFAPGHAFTLIAAFILILVLCIAPLFLLQMLAAAAESENAGVLSEMINSSAFDTVVTVIWLLLVIPLAPGYLYLVMGMARGEERRLSDLFYAYTSFRAYGRAWLSVLVPAAWIAFIYMAASAMYYSGGVLEAVAEKMNVAQRYREMLLISSDVLCVLVSVAGALLFGYFLPGSFFLLDGMRTTVFEAYRRGFTTMRGHLAETVVFHLSFIGWLLLSVLTVGVLFVLFVVPYYLFSLTAYFRSLPEGGKENTDARN